MFSEKISRLENLTVLPAARILLSVLYVSGGIKKLFAYGAFASYLAAKGLPFPFLLAIPAIATELVGGVLLIFGYRLKILASYLAAYTVFTAFTGHPFWTFDSPALRNEMTIQFLKNLAIAGGFLALLAASRSDKSAK